MELTINDYLAQLDKVKIQTVPTDATQIQQPATLQAGLAFVIDQLDAGYLAQFTWQVSLPTGEPVQIALETNLINVPMAEAPRLDPKLLEGDDAKPVNVYLVAQGEGVNASKLRIDLLATATELNGDIANLVEKMQSWVVQQLAHVNENRLAE